MARIGVTNQEAFLRKMALDGLVIKLDLPELKQMISLLRYTSNNINQIAKRLNESGRAYETCSHMQVVLIQPVCVRHHAGYKRGVDCFSSAASCRAASIQSTIAAPVSSNAISIRRIVQRFRRIIAEIIACHILIFAFSCSFQFA